MRGEQERQQDGPAGDGGQPLLRRVLLVQRGVHVQQQRQRGEVLLALAQRLLPREEGAGRIAAVEVMLNSPLLVGLHSSATLSVAWTLFHEIAFYALFALVIIGREIAISALREWMAQIGASRSVAVHMLGKLKTATQMTAIPFLLYDGRLFGLIDTRFWGTLLIIVSSVLTVWSMVYYLQKALPEIRAKAR